MSNKASLSTITSWLDQLERDPHDRETWPKLGKLGPENADVVPLLIERLRDRNSKIRDAAAFFLGQIGEAAQGAVPALMDAIEHGDRSLRYSSIVALGKVGFSTAEPEELLRRFLASDDVSDRIDAAAALLHSLPPEAELLELLRQSHNNEDYVVRSIGASATCELIPKIPDAISVAVEFLDDWESATVEDTARALARSNPELVIPLLLPMLKRESNDARFGALLAIRGFGKLAAEVKNQTIDDLVESLHFMLGDPVDQHAEIAAQILLSFNQIPSDIRGDAEDALSFMAPAHGRFGFSPSVSQDELEALSAQELMPDPNASHRKIRKMPPGDPP